MNRQSVISGRVRTGSQAGFGLIEVLAAVLVLAVGVVGFGALQLRAVQTSGDSYYRTQAMSIAQDLAERARSNSSQMAGYLTATNWPTTAVGTPPTACMTGNCLPDAMMNFDTQSVRYSAQTLLPQGLVRMETCQDPTPGGTPLSCIYVAWDGLLPTAGASGQCVDANGLYKAPPANRASLPCVMLEVQ
ncbi:MAG: pilus assembly protein [Moraxellaceae bacterium]|jgi:type IV pilus assembly protein PilV|nr:pilus assembly protein [Moraxellaceae bacterium]